LLIMRFLLRFIVSCLAAGSTLSWAQGGAVQTDQVRAELVAQAPQGIVAGKPVKLGLFIRHRPQWHTYWKNPGDSGLPTRMEWQLPPGVTAGAIEWPTPHRLPVPPLVNYGYEGDLLLPVPLEVAPTFTADTLVVKLHAEWLVCKDVCIPESGDFTARWPTAQSLVEHGALFDAAQAAMPQAVPVRAQARVQGQALVLEAEGLPAEMAGQEMQFFPELPGVIENAAQPEQRWEGGKLVMRVPLSSMRSESPARMEALLKRPQDARAISIAFDVQGPWPAAGATPAPEAAPVATAAPKADASLWASLALAFGGGLLLNLMPCVFPVLSLKMLALARHADDRRASVVGALAYTAGVLVSFLALAGLLLALRAGGEQLGWLPAAGAAVRGHVSDAVHAHRAQPGWRFRVHGRAAGQPGRFPGAAPGGRPRGHWCVGRGHRFAMYSAIHGCSSRGSTYAAGGAWACGVRGTGAGDVCTLPGGCRLAGAG
jgi:thiol:disulfide interchange protein DsbD